MLRIRKISSIKGMQVYTDDGDFFGEILEANLVENKIDGWKIKISRDSAIARYLDGAKGIIIPHQFVKAIGNIVIVSRSAVPAKQAEEE